MHRITKEQEEFLNKCTIGTWKLNQRTGLVDIDGIFDCSNKGLSDFLGIEFGSVRGYFDCSDNELVSLEGAPIEVRENYYCYNNRLVSLKGAPQKINGSFYCDPVSFREIDINLLNNIYFYMDKKSISLKDYIEEIINGLDPSIYLKLNIEYA